MSLYGITRPQWVNFILGQRVDQWEKILHNWCFLPLALNVANHCLWSHWGPYLNMKTILPDVRIPIIKIRHLWDRLIFIMSIPILVWWCFYIQMALSKLPNSERRLEIWNHQSYLPQLSRTTKSRPSFRWTSSWKNGWDRKMLSLLRWALASWKQRKTQRSVFSYDIIQTWSIFVS